jgi:hypothetical protein
MKNEKKDVNDTLNVLDKQRSFGLFYQGGWKTSSNAVRTAITTSTLDKKTRFNIESIGYHDSDYIKYRVIVDDEIMIPEFNEGSSVMVEGTSIELEQINDGNNFHAIWKALDQQEESLDVMQWSIMPMYGNEVLIARFETEKEFVIRLGQMNWGDNNAYMKVSVDGEYLNDKKTGLPWEFLQGSSVIATGSVITVTVIPTNNKQKEFFGSLTVRSVLNRDRRSTPRYPF